jgi:hypothetical protein
MPYIVQNPNVFTAAFSGALAGMGVSGRVNVDANSARYAGLVAVANAFAEEMDTLWGATSVATLEVETFQEASESLWQGRAPIPSGITLNPLTWQAECQAIIAIVEEALAWYASQGYPNPPIGGEGPPAGTPNGNAYYNSAGVLTSVPEYLVVPLGVFGRPETRDFRQGAPGRGAVFKLGAWGIDGDAQNVFGEGYVVYGQTPTGLGPSATDGGMGFFTPNSFGCYTVINGVDGNNTFPTGAYGDGGPWDPFGVDGLAINDNAAQPLLYFKRSTGFLYLGQGGSLHGSGSLVQMSSTVASRPQYRANQYGANTGVPGISTFKSRGATVGSLAGCIAGDVIGGITCVGVAPDNAAIPLAALLQAKVPAAFVPAGQNWLPTDWEFQTVPLAGPINSRRVVARASSEGEVQSLRGVRAGGKNATPANFGTTGTLWSSGTGDPNGVVIGSQGDLYSRTDGGAGTTFYVKESGTATNTGWVGK